jgi:polar amino acid transport system substrate-binding protein
MLANYVKRRLLLGAAAISASLPALARAAAARQLRIVTAELPPLAMEKGARPGALAELVNELCRRMQLAAAIEFVPWKRAIFLTAGQPATAIFPLSRLPEREAQFRWLAPLFEENYVFLAPRGRAFDVRRPNAMKDKRITLIRASSLIPVVQGLGFHHIVEARSIDEVHRLLVRGMADAAFGEVSIVRNSLQGRGAESAFDIGTPVRKTVAWLAGPLDFTEAEAALFQKTMKAMVDDGTSRKILKSYGLA